MGKSKSTHERTIGKLSSSFNFTYHFLVGAASLTKLAKEIDHKGSKASEEETIQHLGYVCGGIMESVAALESEIWSLYNNGIGFHLGDGIDRVASETLKKVAEDVEKFPILTKYNLALKLARQRELNLGSQPMQDIALLISLRNEITHYKSLFTEEIEKKKLFITLREKDPVPPFFYEGKKMNFYPLQCLTYRRSKWALDTSIQFIEHFYSLLKIQSPLLGHNKDLIKV
jgi:hypothetical protein